MPKVQKCRSLCPPHLRGDLGQLPDAAVIELAAVESDGAHQVEARQQAAQPRPLQHLQHQLALKYSRSRKI